MRRLVSIILALVISAVNFTYTVTVYAYEEGHIEYDGDFIEWLFDYAKRNNVVAVGKYVHEKGTEIADSYGSGTLAKDVLGIADGVMTDILSELKWRSSTSLQAIKNTFDNQPKHVQSNLFSLFNEFGGTNINISPELALELNINAFNQAIFNDECLELEPMAEREDGSVSDYYMTASELQAFMKSGSFYSDLIGGSYPETDAWYQAVASGTFNASSHVGKYFYLFSYAFDPASHYSNSEIYSSLSVGSTSFRDFKYYGYLLDPYNDHIHFYLTHSVSSFVPSSSFVSYGYVPHDTLNMRVESYSYVPSVYSPQYAFKKDEFINFRNITGKLPHLFRSLGSYNYSVESIQGYSSSYPVYSLYFKTPPVATVARIKILPNTLPNLNLAIDNTKTEVYNIVNNYDNSTLENYYDNSYAPSYNDTFETYNYYSSREGNTVNNTTTNNDYSQVINHYITNNNEYPTEHTVVYVTEINNYIQPPSPTPIPTPTPEPTPIPEPTTPPTSTPIPEPTPIPSDPFDEGVYVDFSPLLQVPETLKHKFPFSIPFDIYELVNSIKGTSSELPVVEIVFPQEYFPAKREQKIVIDFAEFDKKLDFPFGITITVVRDFFLFWFIAIFIKNCRKLF